MTNIDYEKLYDNLFLNEIEMFYSNNYLEALKNLVNYYAVKDILYNENNIEILKVLFIKNTSIDDFTLMKLNLSRASFFRKRKEYIEAYKIVDSKLAKIEN